MASCKTPAATGRLAFPGSSTFVGQMEDFGFQEEAVQFRIEFLVLDGHLQNIERAVGGTGLFVRAVGGGKGVENIANRHDLCLDRDFIASQFVGVTCAV